MEVRVPDIELVRSLVSESRQTQLKEMISKYSNKIQGMVFDAAKMGHTTMTYDLTHMIGTKEREELLVAAIKYIKNDYERAGYKVSICYGGSNSTYQHVSSIEVSW